MDAVRAVALSDCRWQVPHLLANGVRAGRCLAGATTEVIASYRCDERGVESAR